MTDDINGWTLPTLRAYVLALLDERDRRYEQRFTAQEQAVDVAMRSAAHATDKASAAMDKRIEAMNEFRAQLSDQAARLMPRSEAQVLLDPLRQVTDRNREDLAGMLRRDFYNSDRESLVTRISTLEVSTHDMLTHAEFNAYVVRQQDYIAANRRAALSSYVAVGLAVLGMVVTVVLFLTGIR